MVSVPSCQPLSSRDFVLSWARRGAAVACLVAGVIVAGCQSAQPGAKGQPKSAGASLSPVEPARPPKAADARSPSLLAQGQDAPASTRRPEPEVPKVGQAAKQAAAESPSADADRAQTPQAPPPSKHVTTPRKVLLLGDSLAATGFGVLLERALDKHPNIDCARRAKSATGLARPDFFDWLKEGKRAVQRHDPELVIVILGGNDGQDLVVHPRKKQRVRWKSEDWNRAYGERVLNFVDSMHAQGRKVLWLGLPRTDTRNFERKLQTIRSVTQEALAKRPDQVTYVNTSPLVEDSQGRLKRKVKHGRRVADLRQSDGIHFTMHGSHYFADRVYPVVLNALGEPDVQAKRSASAKSRK